jgi:hypothetical protein
MNSHIVEKEKQNQAIALKLAQFAERFRASAVQAGVN